MKYLNSILIPLTLAKGSFAKSNIRKAFLSLSILMATSFFASLNAAMTVTFKEFTDENNDYGGAGVEIAWSGSLNTNAFTLGNTGTADRLLVSLDANPNSSILSTKSMIFMHNDFKDFSGITASALRGALIPDPIMAVQSNRSDRVVIFNTSPSNDAQSSSDYIVVGDSFGLSHVVYKDILNRESSLTILTPSNYVSGDSIVGAAFIRNQEFSDLNLPVSEDEIYELTVSLGSSGSSAIVDTITYQVVPEPSTYALIFGGIMLGAISLIKRKHN